MTTTTTALAKTTTTALAKIDKLASKRFDYLRADLEAINLLLGNDLRSAIDKGRIFAALKDKAKHGHFGQIVKGYGLQQRTVQRWMRAADIADNQPGALDGSTLTGLLYPQRAEEDEDGKRRSRKQVGTGPAPALPRAPGKVIDVDSKPVTGPKSDKMSHLEPDDDGAATAPEATAPEATAPEATAPEPEPAAETEPEANDDGAADDYQCPHCAKLIDAIALRRAGIVAAAEERAIAAESRIALLEAKLAEHETGRRARDVAA